MATEEFSFSKRLGLVFVVQSASLSFLAVAGLLAFILYGYIVYKQSASTHVHRYFLSLLVADLIQALGGIMNVLWIKEKGVVEGPYCVAQGVIKQIGDVGVALASLAIAVHTFAVLVFRCQPHNMVAPVVVGLIWLFITLVIALSFALHRGGNYYGSTGEWCWITEPYLGERIGLEYLWLWLAAAVDIVIYCLLALVVKGYLVVDGWHLRVGNKNDKALGAFSAKGTNGIALQMLFYPLVYVITVLPVAIVRWMRFSDSSVHIPFGWTAFASVLFSSSGLLNVILFRYTRPKLMPRIRSNSKETARSAGILPISTLPEGTQLAHFTRSFSQRGGNGHLPDESDHEVEEWLSTPSRRSLGEDKSSKAGLAHSHSCCSHHPP